MYHIIAYHTHFGIFGHVFGVLGYITCIILGKDYDYVSPVVITNLCSNFAKFECREWMIDYITQFKRIFCLLML